MSEKTMPASERARVLELHKLGRMGRTTKEESAYMTEMFNNYPEQYEVLEVHAFSATAPLGSRTHPGTESELYKKWHKIWEANDE